MTSLALRIGLVVLLAAAYVLSGKLGLLLAIPPGYATAVWPPSGVSAAALILGGVRFWPGVFLGSLVVNLWTSGDFSTWDSIVRSGAIACGIGVGAALQAVLAASLVKMTTEEVSIFSLESGVFRILILAGPIACVVNATIGVSTLYIGGLVPAKGVLFNWWTWWVGDSIGVLVFLPLILIWANRPYRYWIGKQVAVSLPTVSIFVAMVAVFFIASGKENRRIQQEFEDSTEALSAHFLDGLRKANTGIRSLADLIEASPTLTSNGFAGFANVVMSAQPAITQIQFAAATGTPGKSVFVNRHEAPVRIRDVNEQLSDALLLQWVEQVSSANDAMSFVDKPAAGITARSVVYVAPVFNVRAEEGLSARERIGGYIIGRIDLDQLGWQTFQDMGAVIHSVEFADTLGRSVKTSEAKSLGSDDQSLKYSSINTVFGGVLTFNYLAPEAYLVERRSWQAWGLLAAGLMLAALLSTVLLVLIGRDARVTRIVAERTQAVNTEKNKADVLISSFPHPHILVDDAWQILDLNPAAARLLNTQREEACGKLVETYFEAGLRKAATARLRATPTAASDGAPVVMIKATSNSGGNRFSLRVSATRLGDHPVVALTLDSLDQPL